MDPSSSPRDTNQHETVGDKSPTPSSDPAARNLPGNNPLADADLPPRPKNGEDSTPPNNLTPGDPKPATDPAEQMSPERIAPDKDTLRNEPQPTTQVGKVAKAAVEAFAKERADHSSWAMILQSSVAGIASAVITLPVCQVAAHLSALMAEPVWNAALGVVVSAGVYIPTYIGLSLYRSRGELAKYDNKHRALLIREKVIHALKFLGVQETCEYALRYGLHVGMMVVGLPAGVAFMASSMVSGFLGRLATPWFSRMFKRKSIAPPPPKAGTETSSDGPDSNDGAPG